MPSAVRPPVTLKGAALKLRESARSQRKAKTCVPLCDTHVSIKDTERRDYNNAVRQCQPVFPPRPVPHIRSPLADMGESPNLTLGGRTLGRLHVFDGDRPRCPGNLDGTYQKVYTMVTPNLLTWRGGFR